MTDDPYLIPGTATLRNLVGITDADELARLETNASVARIAQLLAGFKLPGRLRWDLAHLQAVHRHIFGDVYDWAGTIRTIAMSKGQDFHPLPNPVYAQSIFDRLHADDVLRGLDRPSFVSKVSQLESDLFALHPFREGNTRSTTTFVALVADQAGWRLDWSACDPARFQAAAPCRSSSERLVSCLSASRSKRWIRSSPSCTSTSFLPTTLWYAIWPPTETTTTGRVGLGRVPHHEEGFQCLWHSF